MKIKKILKELPFLPTSALIFYLGVLLFWKIGFIPPPTEMVLFLESLYNRFGLLGLGISSFLESIVYLGLYFPGSFIIVLAVFLSDGKFFSLFSISLVVTIVVTLASFINYFLGRNIKIKRESSIKNYKQKKLSKSFILSLLHPNILSFYFFNAGIKKQGLSKIFFVPIFMLPYGLLHAYILSFVAGYFKQKAEDPIFIFLIILLWLIIAFVIEHKKKRLALEI